MHDPKLIEAMARAMACHFSMNRMPHMSGDPLNRLGSQERRRLDDATEAALTALCAARPDVAALLRGAAVAVPRGVVKHIERLPPGAPQTQIEAFGWISAAMEANRLLAASPWAQEAARDEQS